MGEWSVLIVEDDEHVASVHRRIVNGHPGFHVVSCVGSSEAALDLVARGVRVDLILLDIGLPGADGTRFLRTLRARYGGPEVIAVTAAREPATVQTLMQLGVVDYLVKPFTVERLRQALITYRERVRTLGAGALDQERIDRLRRPGNGLRLPRGLTTDTLERVRAALGEAPGGLTAEEIAVSSSVARVTARRYLEYLVTLGEATSENVYAGPGRPRKSYHRRCA